MAEQCAASFCKAPQKTNVDGELQFPALRLISMMGAVWTVRVGLLIASVRCEMHSNISQLAPIRDLQRLAHGVSHRRPRVFESACVRPLAARSIPNACVL